MKRTKLPRPFLSRFKIRGQIYIVFIFTVVLSAFLIGFLITYQAVNIMLERAYAQLESDNLRVKSIVFDATLTFHNLSDDIANDSNVQRLLITRYPSLEASQLACGDESRFKRISMNYTSISSINIYTKNPTIGNFGTVQNTDDQKVSELFKRVKTPGSIYWESYMHDEKTGSPELTLVRSLPIIKGDPAILVIRMSNNYLKNRIENNQLFVSLSVNRDPIFFSTTRALQGTYESAPIHYDKSYFTSKGDIDYGGKKAFSFISSLVPYKAFNTIYLTSLDFNAPSYIWNVTLLCVMITLLSIIFPLLMIRMFARDFSSRVGMLKNSMHHAKNGNYNVIDTFRGDDELSTTFADLRTLISNIQTQQAKMYEAQITEQDLINKQQKMEFNLLASQINPHFIYNTLETIRMMALSHGARDVSSAVTTLGKTMRYVLENTGTAHTTLQKELDYIESYLAIQKLRFHDRVDYTLSCTDDFHPKNYEILPLLLQPIVENSIIHGLSKTEKKGQITMEIKTSLNNLLISISDNGVGMSLDELTSLKAGLNAKMKNESIGLYNINQRIKLLYGSDFGLEVTSQEGTIVSLTLPLLPTKSQ